MPIDYDSTREALQRPELQATVFAAGRRYTPQQIAVEAARLAYVRSEVSPAHHARLQADLARAELGELHTFLDSSTGAQGFGACRADRSLVLVAFRGTQPDEITDLIHDIAAHSVPWTESAGRVHAGFAGAARAIAAQVDAWLAGIRQPESQLIFTGHSLGAALAMLTASRHPGCELVTLGCPRVGDAAFLQALASTCILSNRYVNCCDVITQIPPVLLGYAHSEPALYITARGQVRRNASDRFVNTDRNLARLRYIAEQAWRLGSVPIRDLADHAPINYVRAVLS